MKRITLAICSVLLLAGLGVIAWTFAGLPPVRMVWSFGFSCGPEPTGRTLTVEGVEFVEIGPGCFRMGSEKNANSGDWIGRWCARFGLPWGDQPTLSDEMPVHWVDFQRGFWIARTEVTNKQFQAFRPEHRRSKASLGERNPVVDVFWGDAKNYSAWLSEQSGLPIRLPSESEWESACRAGLRRRYCFGGDDKGLAEYAWFTANSENKTHEVGARQANAWGLHDMHGNVWEWCEDVYHHNYEGAPVGGTARTAVGPWSRVMRGGSSVDWTMECRSANRDSRDLDYRWCYLGFRPAFSREDE